MTIFVLVGLPGSGKTYFGNLLQAEMDQSVFLDDISQTGGLELLKQDFVDKDIIIADVHLCRTDVRMKAETILKENFPNHEIEWIYFENNPSACLENVWRRNDGRQVADTIKMLYPLYKIPDNVEVKKVYHE